MSLVNGLRAAALAEAASQLQEALALAFLVLEVAGVTV
jgi:hypothetical protein